MRLWQRWGAWSYANPHKATLIVFALLGLFVYLNIVFALWPMVILVSIFAAGMLYGAVYTIIRDL